MMRKGRQEMGSEVIEEWVFDGGRFVAWFIFSCSCYRFSFLLL